MNDGITRPADVGRDRFRIEAISGNNSTLKQPFNEGYKPFYA